MSTHAERLAKAGGWCDMPHGAWIGQHEWRLHKREPSYESVLLKDGTWTFSFNQVGWLEVWYCVLCRKVEEQRTDL